MKLIFFLKLKSDNMSYLVVGIPDFINRGTQVVSKFESVVSQIQKNERDIELKLQSIAMANLLKFPVPDKSNDLPGKTNKKISFIGYNNNCNFSVTYCFVFFFKVSRSSVNTLNKNGLKL